MIRSIAEFLGRARGWGVAVAGLSLCAAGCGLDREAANQAEDVSLAEEPQIGVGSTVGYFFTFNLAGADENWQKGDKVKAVVEAVEKYRPTAFALQEVCGTQANAISRALRSVCTGVLGLSVNLYVG